MKIDKGLEGEDKEGKKILKEEVKGKKRAK
jgi:hypothetical protein